MMKKFSKDEINSQNQMKSSAQRAVRAKVLENFPRLETVLDEIIPKKTPMILAKCHNHIQIAIVEGQPKFFQHRDGPWIPTLRLLHQYPSMMPKMQVDYGAIKFVLRGSNIMCPGLTSPGGRMEDIPAGTVVQITAEGKEFACGIGLTTMSTKDIRESNKGICIENLHTIGDGLWEVISLA